ncbi:MAG: ice-binding family protein [Bacteroidales bacterium]|nr:ice-binding family protein [Bacteroidales bacterium]
MTGDIGTNAGPLTGFPPGTVNGQIHVEDAVSLQASIDLGLTYFYLDNLPCGEVLGTTLGNGQVIVPNTYCIGAAATINGNLTMDGQGDPNALFIIQIDGALETSTYSNVFLINGTSWQNVYWQINGAFTLGDYSAFRGNILANGAIELLEGSSLFGRGLSIAGAIHLHNNIVNSELPPIASADLAIIKTCNTSPVVAGQQIVYTLNVVNNGPGDAQNVTISDVIPLSITDAEFSTDGSTTWFAWFSSYNAGTVATLQNFSLLIRGILTGNPTGSITNTAIVSSTTNDPDLSNNTSTVVVGVNRPPVTFNEYAYTCINETISGNVLLNGDYDPDGTALTVNSVPVVNTVHGTFTVLSNGNFSYIPASGFTGSDMAVVSICDNGIPLPSQCTNDTVFLYAVTAVTADAGADQLLCQSFTTFLTGNFPPEGSVGNWTFVSGPNVVTPDPPNTPAATVSGLIPSVIPYVFRYTISASFPGGTSCISDDTMNIINYYYPSLPYAGPDQNHCLNSGTSISTTMIANLRQHPAPETWDQHGISTTMIANLPVYGFGTWVQQSGPSAALIGDVHDPYTIISGLIPGNYAFLWIIANGICDANQDEVFINVYTPADVNAGPDLTICEGSAILISGSQATNITCVTWATTGSGYFDNTSLIHPVYTPGAGDIVDGSVRLYLTSDCCAPCQSAVDTMILTISRQAVVSAGPGGTVCEGAPFMVIGATAMYATSLLWTAQGPGVLIGETTLTPTYMPAIGQTGIVILTLTAASNAPCSMASSEAMLTINPLPVSNAGPDQSIAFGTSTRLSGEASGGSGTFAFEWQPATLLFGYTTDNPQTVILTEPVTFWFTVTDLMTGCMATDNVIITIGSHNLPPVAVDDYAKTGANIPININILKNDYDPDDQIVSVTLCGGPYNGLVTLNSDCTITYTPNTGFTGNDSLFYFICDNGVPVLCDTATVHVFVSEDSPANWLIIYNVITPNGDGDNDNWIIDGIEKFPNNSATIFNRWGDKINGYDRYDNKTVVWNGTDLQGHMVPDGTYYYTLTIKNGGSRNGWIFVRKGSK